MPYNSISYITNDAADDTIENNSSNVVSEDETNSESDTSSEGDFNEDDSMDGGNNEITTKCLDEFLIAMMHYEINQNEDNDEDSIDVHNLFITTDAGDLAVEVEEKLYTDSKFQDVIF
eukprot:3204233-Ditylum_brightwellii.AAC.1